VFRDRDGRAFGDRLRELITRRRIETRQRVTQRDIARAAGAKLKTGDYHSATVGGWLRNEWVPDSRVMAALAEYFGCDPGWLTYGADSKSHSPDASVYLDPALKEQAETTLAEVGLSASVAMALFYRQVVRHHGLPFDVRAVPGGPDEEPTAWGVLRELAGTVTAPADWASEHDHYVHGTAKRGGQRSGAA
jgi:addiction module RelB/DinJ family antitoxin